MAKGAEKRLTQLETTIMAVLWDEAPVTVRQVQHRLEAHKPLAYNTVLTVMRILRDKGFLSSERQGRTDLYQPMVSRRQMGLKSLRDVMEVFFAGSARTLVSQLLDSGQVSEDEIRLIRREVDQRLDSDSH